MRLEDKDKYLSLSKLIEKGKEILQKKSKPTVSINIDTINFMNRIIDNNFRLKEDNIYFVGDGAGKAGNIVTAAATGLVAARDILNK